MGIILELLGLVVAAVLALGALKRAGIDIGWLNPFSFVHRMRWKKKSGVPPLYALDHPVDVVGVLALATVQTTGLVTAEQKEGVIALLGQHLGLDKEAANNLWILSSHLLRHRPLDVREVPAVLQPSASKFTDYHQQTLHTVMTSAIAIAPEQNDAQAQLLAAVDAFFVKQQTAPKAWGN